MYSDLRIVVLNEDTGKEIMDCHIKHVPRIGEGVVILNKTIYRVKDVLWDSHWYKRQLKHEVRVYVT